MSVGRYRVKVLDQTKGAYKMLTKNTLDKIVYEYQHGGVLGNHPELTAYERKALVRHLLGMSTKCPAECEATHTA